jgi:hypothetical protein
MLWITSNVMRAAAGRASQLGEEICVAAAIFPVRST